jgi:hypothetical protein
MRFYPTYYKYDPIRLSKYDDATQTYIHNKLIREYKRALKALVHASVISPFEAKRRLQAFLFMQFARGMKMA